jgi:hypothetical protein
MHFANSRVTLLPSYTCHHISAIGVLSKDLHRATTSKEILPLPDRSHPATRQPGGGVAGVPQETITRIQENGASRQKNLLTSASFALNIDSDLWRCCYVQPVRLSLDRLASPLAASERYVPGHTGHTRKTRGRYRMIKTLLFVP